VEPGLLQWLEASPLAASVGASVQMIAYLSAAHLLGFTLIMGSAIVANFRLLGVLLPACSVQEVTRPAGWAVAVGLVVSLTTGFLLFAWRATELAANGTFQLKMALLLSAAAFHFSWHRHVSRSQAAGMRRLRATGALGLVLWSALALAGCALILLE
jgi:hypothetical protein